MLKERAEPRMLCAELVNVRWKDRSGRTQKAMGLLEDISTSGACVQLDAPVPIGVTLRIAVPKRPLEGRVVYCVYREIGYFIGLQLDPNAKWSKKNYKPEHMLDLQRLLARAIRSAARRASSPPTIH